MFVRAAAAALFLAAAVLAADAPLAEAARRGDRETVRALLAEKADVNATLADGSTALHWIARADDLETADLLLRAGAKPAIASRRGVTPLELAAVNGSAAMLAKLLDAGADVNASNPQGQTVLMVAARTGNPQAVRLLLDRGAKVNAKDAKAGQTALMFAVTEGHGNAVRLLLDAGADPNARTVVIEQPPATTGNLQGVGRAQNREAPVAQGGMTPLLYAARDGRLEIARMLVAAGADIRKAEANGTSPLLVAIINGQIGVARYLLDQGANVTGTDGFGRTTLWAAVDLRNLDLDGSGGNGVDRAAALELIQALLARSAMVNARTRVEPPSRRWMIPFGARVWVDASGQTPFVRAALAGDVTVMRLLLDHGADPKIPTNGGVTALMAAAGVGWVPLQTYTESPENLLEAVRIAADLGLDVNAVDSRGYAAVHGSAYRGSDEIVQLLAERGARLDVKDKQGRTPAALADGTAYLGGTPLERKASTIALIEKLSAGGRSPQ